MPFALRFHARLYRVDVSVVRCGFEVLVSRNKGGQAIKGLWWMSWRQEAMKDVAWLRYASGSCSASFDPKISELGNLPH
jgi:hypothetical protein